MWGIASITPSSGVWGFAPHRLASPFHVGEARALPGTSPRRRWFGHAGIAQTLKARGGVMWAQYKPTAPPGGMAMPCSPPLSPGTRAEPGTAQRCPVAPMQRAPRKAMPGHYICWHGRAWGGCRAPVLPASRCRCSDALPAREQGHCDGAVGHKQSTSWSPGRGIATSVKHISTVIDSMALLRSKGAHWTFNKRVVMCSSLFRKLGLVRGGWRKVNIVINQLDSLI